MPRQPDIIIPLEMDDPRNADRHERGGERIRLRFNKTGSALVDYVVQYETPVPSVRGGYMIVLRSDGTHGPHFDLYDRFGNERRVWLPATLSPVETINEAVEEIRRNWPALRKRFFRGL